MITVKRLREMLADMPDDAVVVTGAPDHEYECLSSVRQRTALTRAEADPRKGRTRSTWMYEDHGPGTELDENDYRIDVVVVS